MSIFIRTAIYVSLFAGLVLGYIPVNISFLFGNGHPEIIEWQHVGGTILTTIGLLLAVWCVWTFAAIGRGTPAPFDPPRLLVIKGPYRYVRNPMYIGGGLALVGGSLYLGSLPVLGYAFLLLVVTHLFIVLYEEPTLRSTFGKQYLSYCLKVSRWWPIPRASRHHGPPKRIGAWA